LTEIAEARSQQLLQTAGMLRTSIRDEFAGISPVDAEERGHLADAVAWIDAGAELSRRAKPATPPKHLVAYFAVVDAGHMLLVDHKAAQLWLPPGGHVEPGEHPRTTVIRELKEELGIAARHAIAPPLMVSCATTVGLTAGHIDVSLWYVVYADHTQSMTFDHNEFHDIRWFSLTKAPLERSDPNLGRFIKKLNSADHPR
jgi:8-oxo-dGTP diphosphatase